MTEHISSNSNAWHLACAESDEAEGAVTLAAMRSMPAADRVRAAEQLLPASDLGEPEQM